MKIVITFLCALSFGWAQAQTTQKSQFTIVWTDQTFSKVDLTEYLDEEGDPLYWSLKSDSSILFNDQEKNLIASFTENCKVDTTFFSYATTELFLNKGVHCFDLQPRAQGEIRFANKSRTSFGKLHVNGPWFFRCSPSVNLCLTQKEFLDAYFSEYTLGKEATKYPIKLVTHQFSPKTPSLPFTAFPNPSHSLLTIQGSPEESYTFISLDGQPIETSLRSGSVLDISHLALGIYLLHSSTGQFLKVVKH